MSSIRMYDTTTDYQELKIKIISELRKIEDRINNNNSTYYYSTLKTELEKELNAVNQIIQQYY